MNRWRKKLNEWIEIFVCVCMYVMIRPCTKTQFSIFYISCIFLENIVITESGHVKLTDFGGSRPVTQAAKKMISESAKNVFNQLRNGDWKPQGKKKTKEFDMDEDEETEDENDGFCQDYDPEATG